MVLVKNSIDKPLFVMEELSHKAIMEYLKSRHIVECKIDIYESVIEYTGKKYDKFNNSINAYGSLYYSDIVEY